MRGPQWARRHWAAVPMTLVLGLVSLPASAAPTPPTAPTAPTRPSTPSAAVTPPTRPTQAYFGMHQGGVSSGSWPAARVGSIRLWDTNTSWREIQPSRGVWDFTTLDAAVTTARLQGAAPLLVLGQTPKWASPAPKQGGAIYGPGAATMPKDLSDWTTYVQTVATRYRGQIQAYEVWNEADLGSYWQGTMAEMASLAESAYRTIKAVDPEAVVISPSFTTRYPVQRFKIFLYAATGALTLYADALSLHAYPVPDGRPEDSIAQIEGVRKLLAGSGIFKPIWNTEVNYGMARGGQGPPVLLSQRRQSAFVVRTYLLNRSHGVKRVYWYAWDAGGNFGVLLAGADGSSAAAPGRAFSTVVRWMNGRMGACPRTRGGTYRCTIHYRRGTGRAVWNPTRPVTVRAPRGTTTRVNMYGGRTPTRSGARVRVGYAPVLFRTAR